MKIFSRFCRSSPIPIIDGVHADLLSCESAPVPSWSKGTQMHGVSHGACNTAKRVKLRTRGGRAVGSWKRAGRRVLGQWILPRRAGGSIGGPFESAARFLTASCLNLLRVLILIKESRQGLVDFRSILKDPTPLPGSSGLEEELAPSSSMASVDVVKFRSVTRTFLWDRN